MKQPERDALLVELKTTQKLLFDQNTVDHKALLDHLEIVNGTVHEHSDQPLIIKTQRNLSRKALTGYITATAGIVAALWKAFIAS